MCISCWDDHGRPADWNENIERAIALIETICKEDRRGGPLHSVIADWEITGTLHLPNEPHDFSPAVDRAAVELVTLLNGMPERERVAALAYAQGWAPRVR
ncbi:hypothetical protein ABZ897_20030 [Nonomuraea sp. NPDC046802]|uniref:hypothetical protein n=1 Tax=Nonomuraea sp. NPDC046802 TaxID=3154919 RepID=UPI0034049388